MALVRAVEVMGEAATRVDDTVRELAPGVPWRSIIGMRNLLIHGYDGVDNDIIWEVVTRELVAIREMLVGLSNTLDVTG